MIRKSSLLMRVLLLLLVAAMLLPLLVACKKDPTDENGNDYPYEPEADGYAPVVRFAVGSDLHMRGETDGYDFDSREQLEAFYKTAYAYTDSKNYNKLDGIFIVGDYSQSGHVEDEVKDLFSFIKANTREETISKSVLGNHEFYYTKTNEPSHYDDRYSDTSIKKTRENYLKYSGSKAVDEHLIINGFHFIFLSMDLYKKSEGQYYSASQLAWLKTELESAAADDPTGKKPIFVFQHVGPSGTAFGGADKNIGGVLDDYPQVVDFFGHSHNALTNPRSIYQGSYTVLNTGSLAYLNIPIAGHPTYKNSGVRPVDDRGSWGTGDIENAIRTGGMYYIIEVDANNVVRVNIYDLFSEEVHATLVIDSIGSPSNFTYTAAREASSKAPQFAEDAAVSVLSINKTTAMLRFPQSATGDVAQNYLVDIYKGKSRVNRVWRLSSSFLGSAMPDTVDLPLTGLDAGSDYTVKIYPVNDWGKSGKALEFTFRTKAAAEDDAPDLLSVIFNADGSATNAAMGEVLMPTPTVAPSVQMESLVSKYVGVFGGKSGYRFNLYDYYNAIKDGFAMEVYFYVDALPTGDDYVDIVSNMGSGGFGLELKANGKLYFCLHNGTQYVSLGTTIKAGEWIHVVCVFDGAYTKLYVNGVSAATPKKTGTSTMSLPSAASQYLMIGGDADNYTGQNFMKGKIATVNLYSEPLDAARILELYQNRNGSAD